MKPNYKTMKNFLLISIFLLFVILPFFSSAQCREYIEAISESELDPYVLDGNFLSPVVSEGEEVTLVRTFLAGQSYKITVCGMDMFQKEITITDNSGNVIFKNYGFDEEDPPFITNSDGEMVPLTGITYYEFTPEKSMNLKVKVKIVPMGEDMGFKLEGCLGVLVGFKK